MQQQKDQYEFPFETPDSDDERRFAEWLRYHRFNFELHPVVNGKTWDFWIPGLYTLAEVKPFAFWDEIDPMRNWAIDQIRQGQRTRALFVEVGRRVPFFHELITPATVRAVNQLALQQNQRSSEL